MKSKSEFKSEQALLGMLMAIRDKNKDAAMGGLLFLFRHFESGGELPSDCVKNIMDSQ